MSRLDGAELEVLRVVGEGRDKIAYEVRDPEHPEETFVVLLERDRSGLPSFHSDSDAIALLERDLRLFLEAETVHTEQVIRTCDQLINLDPRHELAYFHRGVMRSLRGDFAGAVADLTTATRLAPDDAIKEVRATE